MRVGYGKLAILAAAVAQLKNQILHVTSKLHPSQFQVDDAWIAFQLNDEPIWTERDGIFNCIALMDAASLFILGNAFFAAHAVEPQQLDVRRLFKSSLAHNKRLPAKLFMSAGPLRALVASEAERLGIPVVAVPEIHLLVFVGEAKQGFREYLRSSRS